MWPLPPRRSYQANLPHEPIKTLCAELDFFFNVDTNMDVNRLLQKYFYQIMVQILCHETGL